MDENMRPDGSTGRSESTLKRTDGTSGLAGTWESVSVNLGKLADNEAEC
jgi:hypothetical protein